jgi:hypothetical protein
MVIPNPVEPRPNRLSNNELCVVIVILIIIDLIIHQTKGKNESMSKILNLTQGNDRPSPAKGDSSGLLPTITSGVIKMTSSTFSFSVSVLRKRAPR